MSPREDFSAASADAQAELRRDKAADAQAELRRDKEAVGVNRNTNMNTENEEEKSAAANSSGETRKTPATNSEQEPDTAVNAAVDSPEKEEAVNAAPPETEETAANDDDLQPGDDLTATIVAVAELLGLPDSAKPADLLDAVKTLQRSNEELRAALAEANKNASMSGGTAASSVRYPHLRALNHGTRKATALTGATPNREVTVSVGHGTRAVNCQDKARVDYCTNAVTTAERALGRALTPAEYGRTWAKANSDYTQGVNR